MQRPPLPVVPELSVKQIDGPEARVKTAQLLPYGVRLDLKLVAAAEEPTTNSLVIHADKPGAQISRDIYGQFSEHLGHCIYGGIWVGEDSKIPNTRGIRNDVVAALKKIEVPVLRWPRPRPRPRRLLR